MLSIKNINKEVVMVALVIAGLAFGAGYYATPSKVKTEIKEVVKTVKEEAKSKVVYKERIVYKDGTTVERESESEQSNTKESNESTKTANSETTKDTGLVLSALAIVDSSDIQGHRDYGLHVTKRVFSNINVGVIATTDKKVGVSVGLSF
jgi:hypothetical protein